MKFLKPGDKSYTILKLAVIIGVAVFAARLLIDTGSFHTGLLYLLWPFGLALAVYYFTPHTDGASWKKQLWNNFRISTIAILASSLILMEGYVCVVMAMPIFLFGFLLAFIFGYFFNRTKGRSLKVQIIPLFVLLLSLEGVTDATTFQRYNEVVYSQIIQADAQTIKQRLARPAKPQGNRHWILSIFPMPKTIGAVSMNQGDVRIYEFVYHRWFTTNTHRGTINVTFVEVDENRIKTRIEDTSYIANYLKLQGTELTFQPVGPNSTRVTLKIRFERMIDPIWYFGPLERFAVEKAAKYFVGEILARVPNVMASAPSVNRL